MITVVVQVKVQHGDVFSVKEAIAMHLEELGDVHVISVSEVSPKQLHIEDYEDS